MFVLFILISLYESAAGSTVLLLNRLREPLENAYVKRFRDFKDDVSGKGVSEGYYESL